MALEEVPVSGSCAFVDWESSVARLRSLASRDWGVVCRSLAFGGSGVRTTPLWGLGSGNLPTQRPPSRT